MITSINSIQVQNIVTKIILYELTDEESYSHLDSDQILELIKALIQNDQIKCKEENQMRLDFLFKAFDERMTPDIAKQV